MRKRLLLPWKAGMIGNRKFESEPKKMSPTNCKTNSFDNMLLLIGMFVAGATLNLLK